MNLVRRGAADEKMLANICRLRHLAGVPVHGTFCRNQLKKCSGSAEKRAHVRGPNVQKMIVIPRGVGDAGAELLPCCSTILTTSPGAPSSRRRVRREQHAACSAADDATRHAFRIQPQSSDRRRWTTLARRALVQAEDSERMDACKYGFRLSLFWRSYRHARSQSAWAG